VEVDLRKRLPVRQQKVASSSQLVLVVIVIVVVPVATFMPSGVFAMIVIDVFVEASGCPKTDTRHHEQQKRLAESCCTFSLLHESVLSFKTRWALCKASAAFAKASPVASKTAHFSFH